MYLSILQAVRGHNAQFHRIQSAPCISPGKVGQKFHGVLLDHRIVDSHALFLIIHRSSEQFPNILRAQGMEFKDNRAGNQGIIYFKIWIFRGGSDQNQGAVLHKGKQIILLTFIEPMDLVDEKDGLLPVHSQNVLGFFHHLFHVLFPCHSGVDLGKFRAGGICDDLCQSGLSRTGRAVKNKGAKLVRLDGAVQKLIPPYNMLLSHHLLQGGGPKPGR